MPKRKGGARLVQAPLPSTRLTVFAYMGVIPETVDCLVRDCREWRELEYHRRSQDALIDRARSRAASQFLLDTNHEVLIMVDHDIVWQPGDLQHLALSCARTKGVVAGIYPKRAKGVPPPVRFAGEGRFTIGSDELAEMRLVSTGFMAIHRDVLVKLSEEIPKTIGDFWPFFAPTIAENPNGVEYLSEDWAFCARARHLGFPIHADLRPILWHVGEYVYRMVDAYDPPTPDRTVTINVDMSSVRSVPAVSTLSQHLSEFTRVPLDRMGSACTQGRQDLASLWHRYGPSTDEEITDWYRKKEVGRDFLLDLADWHFRGVADGMVRVLGDLEGKRVLDFGAGIATVPLHLAQHNEVECVEPNEVLRKFADFRGEKLGVSLKWVEEPTGEYDLVICWHVFEHLPHPEETLKVLLSHLKGGGHFFSQSDFRQDTLHPMHQVRSDWDGVLRRVGLHHEGNFLYAMMGGSHEHNLQTASNRHG